MLVADLESFSAAARKLELTQPAVSFQIKALEKEVGASLFDRTPGKVILTPAGRTTYSYSKKILEEYRRMIVSVPKTTGAVTGTLRISASNIPGEYILPEAIAEFKTLYPDVMVSLEITDSGGALERLSCEQTELSFMGTALEKGEMLSSSFATDKLVVITHPDHHFSRKREITIEDISVEPFINRMPSSGTRKTFEAILTDNEINMDDMNIVAEIGSTQSVINAVKSGIGISIVSDRAAAGPFQGGLLYMADISGTNMTREFFAVHSKERPLSVAAARFLEYCLYNE